MADLTCDGCAVVRGGFHADEFIVDGLCPSCRDEGRAADIKAERDELRAHNDHLRATMSHLLIFARGNDHLLGIIHDALDWRPATGEDAP